MSRITAWYCGAAGRTERGYASVTEQCQGSMLGKVKVHTFRWVLPKGEHRRNKRFIGDGVKGAKGHPRG